VLKQFDAIFPMVKTAFETAHYPPKTVSAALIIRCNIPFRATKGQQQHRWSYGHLKSHRTTSLPIFLMEQTPNSTYQDTKILVKRWFLHQKNNVKLAQER